MTVLQLVRIGILLIAMSGGPLHMAQSTRLHSQEKLPQNVNVTTIERTAKVIDYRVLNGSSTVNFRGTELWTEARAAAVVKNNRDHIGIEVETTDLPAASRFGPEYLTYVMWAISPEGRAINLGELMQTGRTGKLNVTTQVKAFGLILTA